MASKRKLEDDSDALSPSVKVAKTEEVPRCGRSGRIRKKPARFKDTEEDFDEECMVVQEPNTKERTSQVPKSPPLQPIKLPDTPVIPKGDPPKPIKAKLLLTSTSGKATLVNVAAPVVPTAKIATVTAPEPVLATDRVPTHKDTTKTASLQVITTNVVPATQVIPISMESPVEVKDTPKSGRVRKKSTKVLEMEAFEEAEKKKVIKAKVASPTALAPSISTPISPQSPVAMVTKVIPVKLEPTEHMLDTSIPPKTLSKPAITGKIDPALANLPPFPPSKLGTPSSKKVKKKEEPSSIIQPIPPPSVIASSSKKTAPKSPKGNKKVDMMDPIETYSGTSSMEASTVSVKKEPGTPVTKKLVLGATSKAVVKEEPVSPAKSQGKKSAVEADPAVAKKSVIKMLLNTPAHFSTPSVSTQSINTGKKQMEDVDTEALALVKTESPSYDLSPETVKETVVETTEHLQDSSDKKKQAKKVVVMYPSEIEDFDDDEDDDEDEDEEEFMDHDQDDSPDWEFENQDGKLVIADFVKDRDDEDIKGKKINKKGKAASKKTAKDGDDKKGGKQVKEKEKEKEKEKKKKRLTAYTMWCNSVRHKVLTDNQGMDFAQLSRRLGEIWQTVPAKEKMAWKRKAKREARKLLGKGLLITTSKGGGGVIHTSIPSASAVSAAAAAAVAASSGGHQPAATPILTNVQSPPACSKATKLTEESLTSKSFGIEPIDVSAHLKLLGDSLSIIGMRLQEHRGLIAVQGSLSVLLDSMLCAMGPLMCLTSQVNELYGCAPETHSHTLDNTAYFMPGL